MGVVVVVEALHGLGEAVNRVEGLLKEPTVDDEAWIGWLEIAANACNSGIKRGGRAVWGLAERGSGKAMPNTESSS